MDNDGSVIKYGAFPNYYINTCLGDKYPVSYEFSRITITNNGVLILGSNVTLVATNTVINGDPSSEDDGIQIVGGSFIVPDNFTYSDFFICIARYWESFSHLDGGIVYDTTPIFQPSTSLTIDNDAILYIDQLHTMTNTLTVKSGGMLSQTHNPVHASLHEREENKVMLDLRGNLVIETGGKADVSDKGLGDDAPGTHEVNNCGGSYGGLGDGGLSCYGSIVAPTNLGSGGRGSSASLGGGAMILNVTGVISNNGAILANSGDSSTRTGSGGSIQVVAGTITGTGPIEANSATNVTGSNPGGGGRISLTLTNSGAGFAGYAGSITAYGGRKPAGTSGGAGTVYLREAGQGPQEGLLLIDNDGLQCIATEISQSVLDTVVGDVTIQGSACLLLNTNQVLTVNGDWNNTSCFTGYTDSVVSFTGPPNSTSTVAGTTTFSGLFCTNTPKTLLFTAGSASAIASYGRLVLMGSASDDLVLRSTADNNAWDLEVDPAAEQVVANVDVRDSDAGGSAEVTAVNSTDSGSNTNWRFVTVVGSETNRWTGASSTVWSARENWNLDRSPSETDIIVVPAGCPHYPALDADRTVNCLQIDSNAFLELANRNLTVTNELTVRGALIASGAETITLARNADLSDAVFTPAFSTVVLNGETDQSFNPGELTYYKITVLNQSGTVHFRGGMEATELRCEAPSGTRSLQFAEGASFVLYDLVLSGSTSAPNISLRSSSTDQKWNLNVSGYRSVCGVDVRDSDASGGLTIPATLSQDSSHNINWNFTPALAVWVGGTSESFHDADNWEPTGVPGAASRALVESATPMVITSAVTLLDLTVGGGANSATAKVDSALTIVENIMILTNGTLLLNRPSTAGEGLFMEAGGVLSHSANTTSEVNKIELTVSGDAIISAGGNIDVTAKGYMQGYGPGYSQPSASYGGRGGNGYSGSIMSTGRCYGSISAPTNLGSGGSSYVGEPGGGAIILRVSGELRHDGAMCANAKDGGGNRGAGGTVFLKCDSMSGTGTIQAHGGCCTVHSPGGGGRIALVVTNKSAGFYRFTGNATAYSGRKLPANTSAGGAGAGTIYCETARDGAEYGKVTIDNADYTTTRVTEVPPLHAPTGETARIASIIRIAGNPVYRLTRRRCLLQFFLS